LMFRIFDFKGCGEVPTEGFNKTYALASIDA